MVIRALMSNKPSMRRRPLSAVAGLVALSGLAFAFAAGGGVSEAATSRGAESASIAKGPKAETDVYAVEMKTTGPYAAGKEGTLEITIEPRGVYHVNEQYPTKFKLMDPAPEGVTFPKPILKKEDGSFSEKKGSFKVPFVASKAGKTKISGTLSISMCSPNSCVMEKVDLEVDVDVK